MPYEKVTYNNEYNKKNYTQLMIRVTKNKKDIIETHWKSKGYKSLNSYVNDLIDADMGISKNEE